VELKGFELWSVVVVRRAQSGGGPVVLAIPTMNPVALVRDLLVNEIEITMGLSDMMVRNWGSDVSPSTNRCLHALPTLATPSSVALPATHPCWPTHVLNAQASTCVHVDFSSPGVFK
jgi:hypothetical protein